MALMVSSLSKRERNYALLKSFLKKGFLAGRYFDVPGTGSYTGNEESAMNSYWQVGHFT